MPQQRIRSRLPGRMIAAPISWRGHVIGKISIDPGVLREALADDTRRRPGLASSCDALQLDVVHHAA